MIRQFVKCIKKSYHKCLGIIYPQTCCFCGEISKNPICSKCFLEISYVKEPRCKKCGKPIRYIEQELCHDCDKNNFAFEQGKSIWIHEGKVKWSIYQFKFHNKRIYGEFYAKEFVRLHGKWIRENEIDLIIPVPLHAKRRRQRGYNQAEIIATYLGEAMGIKVDSKAIVRVKATEHQKVLDNQERRKNLRQAFCVTKNLSEFKNLLIVDDIYTTGSTINEIANTIKLKFACKVWFLTISIGQGF